MTTKPNPVRWKVHYPQGRSDCSICGYASLSPDLVLEMTTPRGKAVEICHHCASSIQAMPAPLSEEGRWTLAKGVAKTFDDETLAGIERCREVLRYVGDDETLAVEVIRASDAAGYINAVNYVVNVWLPENRHRVPVSVIYLLAQD